MQGRFADAERACPEGSHPAASSESLVKDNAVFFFVVILIFIALTIIQIGILVQVVNSLWIIARHFGG